MDKDYLKLSGAIALGIISAKAITYGSALVGSAFVGWRWKKKLEKAIEEEDKI